MATHSSILAWRIPWTEKPGGLQSMGLGTVRHNITTEHTHRHNRDRAGARKVQRRYLSIFGVEEVEVSGMINKRNRLLI